jgi:hypothetical protein
MTKLQKCLALTGLILVLASSSTVFAAAKDVDFGIEVSSFDCHGSIDRFSFVATWSDLVGSGAYNIKLGNQCVMANSVAGKQCTTNSPTSCRAPCTRGKCRAEFSSCHTGRPGAFSVVSTNGLGYHEKKYAVPDCKVR